MEQFTSLKINDSEILPLRPIEELLDIWIVCPNTVVLVEGAILVINFTENESAQVRSGVIVDNKIWQRPWPTGLACAVRVDLDLLLGIFYKSTREVLRLLRPIYMLNKDNVCCGFRVTNDILDH